MNKLIDLLKTPFMWLVGVALVLGVILNGLVGIARDHKSAELICVEAGGDYNSLTKFCDLPPVDR